MRRRPRRAYMIVRIITWLPLIAVGTTIAFMISAQSLRLQAREKAQIATESVVQDLVRRIQADAREAVQLTLTAPGAEAAAAMEMASANGDGKIVYRVKDALVVREETAKGSADTAYTWNLGNCSLTFSTESFGASPCLLWMTFLERVPRDRTAASTERFSTTAIIGKGGRR